MTLQPAASGPTPAPFLVSIGNIHATQHHVVTPAGSWPIAEVNVSTHDHTSTTTHTPAWAIVMVILFIWFFLLSLLFLLARETRVSGYVNVTVWGPGGQAYVENVPVWNAVQRGDVFNRVGYLQGLIGAARGRMGFGA
ncbi:hypothetical protein FLP10_11315 [Agromyces intestinalis]|uniref:Uncharacterized protein n=1 Tax=Agromyces intestinalis TaxID=2592652 RepID=A0A5C1YIJ5_9MICO|nr:hypothetical protein [Agromyces intestinalis]QEO14939.1 hypothetical protein FLP10_11315 [Agromyces intestinalis]